MYAVANNTAATTVWSRSTNLPAQVTDVGLLRKTRSDRPVEDMEGFSFYNDGTFYGTTGERAAANNPSGRLTPPPASSPRSAPFANYGDYESVACLAGRLQYHRGHRL